MNASSLAFLNACPAELFDEFAEQGSIGDEDGECYRFVLSISSPECGPPTQDAALGYEMLPLRGVSMPAQLCRL